MNLVHLAIESLKYSVAVGRRAAQRQYRHQFPIVYVMELYTRPTITNTQSVTLSYSEKSPHWKRGCNRVYVLVVKMATEWSRFLLRCFPLACLI